MIGKEFESWTSVECRVILPDDVDHTLVGRLE
jgi:hypothetical protein